MQASPALIFGLLAGALLLGAILAAFRLRRPRIAAAILVAAGGAAAAASGDAGQRALVGWSMGWQPALEASSSAWLAPHLAHLLNDPYATVRFIAQRSLRSQTRYQSLIYDFIAPPEARIAAREAVLGRWFELPLEALDRTGPELLIDEAGNLNYAVLRELGRRRDDTPLFLAE